MRRAILAGLIVCLSALCATAFIPSTKSAVMIAVVPILTSKKGMAALDARYQELYDLAKRALLNDDDDAKGQQRQPSE